MTCIVGVKDKKGIVIAGDRMGSNGISHCLVKEPKVFAVGDFVFGCTSSFRMIDIIKHCFVLPQRPEGVIDEQYLRRDFIRSIRDCFNANGFGISNGDWKGGFFLFSYRSRLYVVESDYQVREVDYCSVGCGADTAMGAIHCSIFNSDDGVNVCDAELTAIRAIKAASKHCVGVSEEYDLVRINYQSTT